MIPTRNLIAALLPAGVLAISLWACKSRIETSFDQQPYLKIENGVFSVDAIVLERDTSYTGMPLGSGTLSFDYTGELEGHYAAQGRLINAQRDAEGVGAILAKILDLDYEVFREGLSILAFKPRGDGKADIFILGTKIDVSIDSIKAGDRYGIGQLSPFNGLFLVGLDIDEFWAGQKNFINIADHAFILTIGLIEIAARDSTRIDGSFTGSTDINRP